MAADRCDYVLAMYLARYAGLRIHECFRIDTATAEQALRENAITIKGKGGKVRTVTLFTGLREGEVMGLMWDCVDFDSGTLLINKQLQYFREEHYIYRLVSTKNGKGRVLKPAPSVMAILKAHKAAQEQQRVYVGTAWEDSNLVFTDVLGHHLTNSIVYRHFKRAAAAIGRPDARFHDLRHSYAVASIRSGDDIKTVQDNLGHATASFTLDVYGHVTEQMKQASSNRMEQFYKSVALQEDNKAKNKAKL